MQLKCQQESCFGHLIRGIFNGKTELGLTIKYDGFKCEKCGIIYIPCDNCDGEGFDQTIHGYLDCDVCHGSGLKAIIDNNSNNY